MENIDLRGVTRNHILENIDLQGFTIYLTTYEETQCNSMHSCVALLCILMVQFWIIKHRWAEIDKFYSIMSNETFITMYEIRIIIV